MSKTTEISDELYESIKAIKDQLSDDGATDITSWSDFVGQKIFVRTVTYHLVGKVVAVNGNLVELKDASWVASSGRFMQAIKDGTLQEVEPVGKCWFNTNACTDIFPWAHPLPSVQK